MGTHNKIVLFPKQKRDLEQKAFTAIQEEDFSLALEYFEQLFEYGVTGQEVALGKLTCLIELGRQEDAEDMCEMLIAQKDENYFSYINIYATFLFQIHKHKEVAQLLEDALNTKDIPLALKSQLEKLYNVNRPLVDEQLDQEVKITKRELIEAYEVNDSLAQWHLVNHLQNVDINPYINLFERMLKNKKVHPVIKTVIVGLLQATSVDKDFKVFKFGTEITINTSTFPYLTEHPFRVKLLEEMSIYEQENPTFYQLSEQLINRYLYVLYPLSPKMSEIDLIKKAIVAIVQSSFEQNNADGSDEIEEDISRMANQIIEVEKVYFSVMDE